jgi:NurA-like 5'-3' nuclease
MPAEAGERLVLERGTETIATIQTPTWQSPSQITSLTSVLRTAVLLKNLYENYHQELM